MLAVRSGRRAAAPMLQAARRALSTVVDDEVRKFNAISTDWWSPQSTSGVGPLHQINPVRVKYIRERVIEHFAHTDGDDPAPLRGLRVADVGCGGGVLSEALRRIGGDMVSVDPGEDNIAAAKRHAARHPVTQAIDYRCCTSDDLVAAGEQFDVVCSLEVIEHVADVEAFLKSLTPLVKPGGLLFLSSINRTLLSGALAIGAAEYLLRVVPPGTHDWNKFVDPDDIVRILKQEGLETKDVSGLVGDPITRKWRIHPTCTQVNYVMCATKPM